MPPFGQRRSTMREKFNAKGKLEVRVLQAPKARLRRGGADPARLRIKKQGKKRSREIYF